MKLKITFLLSLLVGLVVWGAEAQTCPSGYVPKPTQNCVGAIPLCNLSTTYATGVICGPGATPGEIPSGSCLSSDERNTTWYVFTVRTSGKLKFKIRPLDVSAAGNGNTDYDWAVFKLPAGQVNSATACAAVSASNTTQFSCNYSAERGVTGMYDTTGTLQVDVQDATGSKFNRPRDVLVGESFVLAVDNFSGGDQIGYTIVFADPMATGGSGTASIVPPPDTIVLQSISQTPSCTSNKLRFSFDRPVRCDSVKATKFSIKGANPPYTIVSVVPVGGCGGEGQKQTYDLTFTPAITDSTYQLFVRDEIRDICKNSVRFDSIPFRIEPFLNPIKVVAGDTAVCPNRLVTLRADTTLVGTYTYIWKEDGVVISGAINSSYSFIPTSVQRKQYKVIARLQSGCVDSAATFVRLVDLPSITMPTNDTLCFEGRKAFKTLTPVIPPIDIIGGGALTYKWTSARDKYRKTVGTQPTFDAPIDTTDTYRLTVTNERGCVISGSTTLIVGDSIVAYFEIDTLAGAAPLPVIYTNLSEGQRVRYFWDFGDSFAHDTIKTAKTKNTFHVYRAVAENDSVPYITTLTVSDTLLAIQKKLSLNGCTKTFSRVVKVVPFITPNVTTPNGDGKNDGFRFSGWSSELALHVYNRWGKLVFKSESYKNDWDTSKLPAGTYFYYLEDKQLNRQSRGWVDILGEHKQ